MKNLHYTSFYRFFLKKIGEGAFAKVYKLPKQQKVIKVYKRNARLYKLYQDALEFTDDKVLIENNSVVPEGKVYINFMLNGYVMPYIEGDTAYSLQKRPFIADISYHEFLKAYYKALYNIKTLGIKGYWMRDVHDQNIIYDKKEKCFKFLDVDNWDKDVIIPDICLEEHNEELIEDFKFAVNIEKLQWKFKNKNIMYSKEEVLDLFQVDENTSVNIYDDPFIEKTIKIYKPKFLADAKWAINRFQGRMQLEKCDILIPEEPVYVENILSGYTTKKIDSIHIENVSEDLFSRDTLQQAYKRAIANIETISEMGFALCKDFTKESMLYDYKKGRFYFDNLHVWKISNENKSKKETTENNVKCFKKTFHIEHV